MLLARVGAAPEITKGLSTLSFLKIQGFTSTSFWEPNVLSLQLGELDKSEFLSFKVSKGKTECLTIKQGNTDYWC